MGTEEGNSSVCFESTLFVQGYERVALHATIGRQVGMHPVVREHIL